MKWDGWSLGFIPKQVAFGILSVLLPLYVIQEVNGSLLDVGMISFFKSFIQIPATILWARYINKKGKCKIFILMPFLISSLIVFLFAITESVWLFLGLNALLYFFYAAQSPASRILMAESSPSDEWKGKFARHRLLLSIGEIAGLVFGALWTTRLGNRSLMLLCGVLVSVSLILSTVLIHDPPFMMERWIARLGRFVYLAEQSYDLVYAPPNSEFKEKYYSRYPNLNTFILGIFLFPLASSMVFTSIPVYLFLKIGATSSLIFYILLIKSVAILIGYSVIRKQEPKDGLKMIKTASILRIFLPLLIAVSGFFSFYPSLMLSSLALAISGFAYPYFSVSSTTLWMEIAPKGRGWLFSATVNLGTALGGIFGGFIPSYYGYETLFMLSTAIFGISMFFFTLSSRMKHS